MTLKRKQNSNLDLKKRLLSYGTRYRFQMDEPLTSDYEKARTGHKTHLEALSASLELIQSPQSHRSLTIHALRLLHLIEAAQIDYITASRAVSRKDWACFPSEDTTLPDAISYKFNATYLSILDLLRHLQIPTADWFFAQFHYLKRSPYPVTPFHCYGPAALRRYRDWCKKQKRTYVRDSESQNRLLSKEAAFTRLILDSHEYALSRRSVLSELNPPSVACALLYLWPQSVSSWYVLAYPVFCSQFVDTGIVDDPFLLQCWESLKRKPTLRALLQDALSHAEAELGPLVW